MKYGFHLPQTGAAEEIARIARRAEETRWSSIWVSDHLVVPVSGALPPIQILEPIAVLSYAAAVTKTIRMGTSVIVVPYRNAIHLAKELATLDRLCGGRLIFGAGTGWLEAEFRALNAPYERRGRYTDEALRLMRELWAKDDPAFNGEFFNLTGMRFGPRPAAGRIPIWIGGVSRRAARRAVELGDGYHGSRMRPEQFAQRLNWIREIAEQKGRKLDGFAITHRVYIGFADNWTDTGGYIEGVLAPPKQIAEYLNRFAEIGVEEILVTPIGADRSLDKFMDVFDREVRGV